MRTVIGKSWLVALALMPFAVAGCGDDKSDKKGEGGDPCEDGETAVGKGWVAKAKGTKAKVCFNDAEVGSEFIVMPYALGDLATVKGGGAENFDVTFGTGSGLRLQMKSPEAIPTSRYGFQEYDHDKRTLLNRFDPSKGLEQGAAFWAAVDRIDRFETETNAKGVTALSGAITGETATFWRGVAAKGLPQRERALSLAATTTAGACPSDLVVPTFEGGELDTDTIFPDASKFHDEGDYCLVLADDPITEPEVAKIKSTIKTVLTRFKSSAFYNDQFAAGTDYTFKPIVAIVDFLDDSKWPQQSALKGVGFFLGVTATAAKVPTLYMVADATDIGEDEALARPRWHGTLAHEMQHAIIDYYRARNPGGTAEEGSLDEGLAHIMEDVFGYGQENFKGFPGNFLSTFANGLQPVVDATDSGATSRGAMQSLLYYLASQKGGFTKVNGVIGGGEGLSFLINLTKNATKAGAQNLIDVYGGDWLQTVGDFFGAVVVDGSKKIAEPGDAYVTQTPVTGVKDLHGGSNKTFGMKFNDWGDLGDRFGEYEAPTGDNATIQLTHYKTQPMKVTVTKEGETLDVTFSAAIPNAAVSVMRIK